MGKQAFCYFVIGASLSLLLGNLARRRALASARPARRAQPAEVIDLAAWREARCRAQAAG